ncbi:MAG: amidohydrolase [Actinobacteria bacterium]|nr:amidohydrolase [Actinomycetota bacterium]
MSIDPGAVEAIDTHVHVESDGRGRFALDQQLLDASARYFKAGTNRTPALDEISDYYRERRLAAVVFTVDAHTATGHPALSSEDIVTQAAAHADVLVPFASVDPHDGPSAVARLRDLAAAGAKGLKLHPSLQAFSPDDRAHYPLYETAAELGLPVIFHTGQTGIGAGLPGGRGIKLRYSDPMLIDDVAADHPSLTIVLAHPSVPWQDAAISIATHKANVYIDLSGWSPKYFPPQLIRAANGLLKHKMLFGSDYPVLTPDRWLADFAALDIKPDVRPLILRDNAATVLGLHGPGLDGPGAADARLRSRQLAAPPGADQPGTGRPAPGRARADLPAARG